MKSLPLKVLWIFMMIQSAALAAIQTETVEYKDGKTILEGFWAYDDTIKTPRPTVLIVHQWAGLSDYEKMRARKLAELGYVAFALDIYGKGVRPQEVSERSRISNIYKNDRALFRQREMAALNFIKKSSKVDKKKIVVIGYCFGGTGALELARAGADVAGVVSFHGSLTNPNPKDVKNMKMPIMVHHGAIDPYVPAAEVDAFKSEMNAAQVDYVFSSYANAVHSFTDRAAGSDSSKGSAYNDKADQRSWTALLSFLREVDSKRY